MKRKFTLISLLAISAIILCACTALPASSGAVSPGSGVPEAGVPEAGVQNNAPGGNSGLAPLAGSGQAVSDVTQDDAEGYTAIDADTLNATLASLSTGTITPDVAAGLAYMREEEKLAHWESP